MTPPLSYRPVNRTRPRYSAYTHVEVTCPWGLSDITLVIPAATSQMRDTLLVEFPDSLCALLLSLVTRSSLGPYAYLATPTIWNITYGIFYFCVCLFCCRCWLLLYFKVIMREVRLGAHVQGETGHTHTHTHTRTHARTHARTQAGGVETSPDFYELLLKKSSLV